MPAASELVASSRSDEEVAQAHRRRLADLPGPRRSHRRLRARSFQHQGIRHLVFLGQLRHRRRHARISRAPADPSARIWPRRRAARRARRPQGRQDLMPRRRVRRRDVVNARRLLLELFDAALRAVDGRACVARDACARRPSRARSRCSPSARRRAPWRAARRDALGARIERMLVITKDRPRPIRSCDAMPTSAVLESRASRARRAQPGGTARTLERRLANCRRTCCRCSWSRAAARASSKPARRRLARGSARAQRTRPRRGLGHRDAERANARSCRASRAAASRGCWADGARLALFISDVPGDDPGVIGSGLLGRDAGRDDRVGAPRRRQRGFGGACRRAGGAARRPGARDRAPRASTAMPARWRGEFVEALRSTTADGLVWGGESTVELPANSGRGGRNTHLALAAARLLRAGEPLTILAAGTDGTDGPTDDAGAIVDAGTVERAELGGLRCRARVPRVRFGDRARSRRRSRAHRAHGHERRGYPDRHQTICEVASWPHAASRALIAALDASDAHRRRSALPHAAAPSHLVRLARRGSGQLQPARARAR